MVLETTRSDVVRLAIFWIILSAIAEAATVYIVGDFSAAASAQGEVTSEAVLFLLWVTIPVFTLIVLAIFYAMIKFRVADDDEISSEKQYRSGWAFPWGWVAMSVILNLLFIVHPGLNAIWSMARAATDPVEVDVTAAQWRWSFAYPRQELANVAELVVPVDTPIRFMLRTNDVIHSFWVPAWGIKKAVIPGETRTLVVTPNRIVDTVATPLVRLQCSQICGVGHAEMRSIVRVVSRADFDEWVKTTKAAADYGGMQIPGMDMHGVETPGMQMENDHMPAQSAPMQEGMPGMNAPENPPQEKMPMDQNMPNGSNN